MAELIRIPLYREWLVRTKKVARWLLISVVIFSSILVFVFPTSHIRNPMLWSDTMRRISITGISLIMLLEQPNALRVVLAGLSLTCNGEVDIDLESGETSFVLENSKERDMIFRRNPITPVYGYTSWVQSEYTKLDITGLNADSKLVDMFHAPLWFTAMGILFNIGCLLQYSLCISVAWPLQPLIPYTAYWIIQSTSLISVLGSVISLRFLQ